MESVKRWVSTKTAVAPLFTRCLVLSNLYIQNISVGKEFWWIKSQTYLVQVHIDWEWVDQSLRKYVPLSLNFPETAGIHQGWVALVDILGPYCWCCTRIHSHNVSHGDASYLQRHLKNSEGPIQYQGLYSLRHHLIGIGIPIINLRWLSDCLRFIMGIPIPVTCHLFSE